MNLVPDSVRAELRRQGVDTVGGAVAVAGGSISRSVRVDSDRGPVFLKLERRERADMLVAETEALAALRDTGAVAVPAVLGCGIADDHAYVAVEWIDFGQKTPSAERSLGDALARLHRTSASEFGWHRDNYIGSTPQRNDRRDDWPGFFRDMRLARQLALARQRGLPADDVELGDALLERIASLLEGHEPRPSLLHGDLWGGNWGAARDGTPYLYDPAAYFGDRETDIAMTRLFGGFGREFYAAYEAAWPLPRGVERRAELYNLYHLLNHFNLFGGAYAAQVAAALRRLTSRRRSM